MILMYHKVSPDAPTMWWVTVDSFYRQLHALQSRQVVYLDDYDPDDPTHVVITFDGIYRNILQYAAPLLRSFDYPFELFVTSNYIGKDNRFDTPEPFAEFASPEELKELVTLGGRLQWHSRSHPDLKVVHDATRIAIEIDIPDSVRALDPSGFGWFAYPHGEYNDDVVRAVRQHFRGAVSCNQGNDHDPWRLNRITVTSETSLRENKVSVIIPCHNYGAYLPEAVESVIRQTLPPDEILVSDDASTDDTPEVMRVLAQRYGARLKLHRNATNMGIVAHFNQAVQMTSGDYICFLGADNRYRSDFIEKTTALLDCHSEAAVAYTDFALFGPRATLVADEYRQQYPVRSKAGTFHLVEFPAFDDTTRDQLISRQNFIHGSSLFRRKAFEQVSGYRDATIPEDWSLFKRMVEAGWSAIHCPMPLLEYRQHSREQANVHFFSEVELQHYKNAYRQLESEIRRIKHTVSWRITAPLRAIWNLSWRSIKLIKQRLG